MSPADDPDQVLIDCLYDAAAGITGWGTALDTLVEAFDASVGAFGIVGPQVPGRILHSGVGDPALVARYLERHAGRNELSLRTATLPAGAVITDTAVMPKAEFLRTAFYTECLQPAGLHALMNCRAARRPDGLVANICLFRTAAQGDFTAADVARYRRLAPHLVRAAALEIRVTEAEGERHALVEALERMPGAAFVVDKAATVLRANRAGAALLAAQDGLRTSAAEGGALHAAQPAETTALRRLVAAAAEARSGAADTQQLCLSRPAQKPPLVVTILPLGAQRGAAAGLPPAAAALLLATSPELRAAPPSISLLREAFGLTRAEAEVAARAALGEDVASIAGALGITQGTTRLHLHRVFEKTGLHRQAELVVLLSRLKP